MSTTGLPHHTVIASTNPCTGQLWQSFEPHSEQEIERRLALAFLTSQQFGRIPFSSRAAAMLRASEILEIEKNAFARTMTLEMGKPYRAAVQEVEKCSKACRFYAENAAKFLADEHATNGQTESRVCYQPLGVILAIMPWNFPFWQVFRFAVPALMAGNVGLLKHASNVPQCALAIESIFRRAGFPEGAFQTLLIGSQRVAKVIEDVRVNAVTLTGSLSAGASVAAIAGKQIKKTVLELGGSDPFIVMPSADLDRAVATAVQARTINNGESCIAAKRFIIDKRIAQDFEQRFTERMKALKVGDPMDPCTDVGPLATASVLEALEIQVQETVRQGARLLLGGERLLRDGFFFAPTVLADIPSASPAYKEELFGPVASLFVAEGLHKAIRIANDTPFGLGSCIWTNDETEKAAFIEQIQAGLAFVNGMVASDPALPFGGIKQSGYGRELSHHGIREFVNVKTVVIANETKDPGQTE